MHEWKINQINTFKPDSIVLIRSIQIGRTNIKATAPEKSKYMYDDRATWLSEVTIGFVKNNMFLIKQTHI